MASSPIHSLPPQPVHLLCLDIAAECDTVQFLDGIVVGADLFTDHRHALHHCTHRRSWHAHGMQPVRKSAPQSLRVSPKVEVPDEVTTVSRLTERQERL